ncbi:MAG: ADP-ribosylglycohydrolase family protein [Puniceicoccaceae bacterium]
MQSTFQQAMLGARVADALAMPVHWYYDRQALARDYPVLRPFAAPKNPHPDSILWRSRYTPRNKRGDILHQQKIYWGQREIHYHQFLKAGENTLNFQLGLALYRQILHNGHYDPDQWLDEYISCMLQPGWHNDTYIEEYHREFFDRLSRNLPPRQCGIEDIHIGGLATLPFLLAGLIQVGLTDLDHLRETARTHTALTHRSKECLNSAVALTGIIFAVASGETLQAAIFAHASHWISEKKFLAWRDLPDLVVVGRHLTPACYLPDSFTASLYLAAKYHQDFAGGVLANARCGGDNSHRGAVLGALLGAANPIPEDLRSGLLPPPEPTPREK